MVSARIGEPPGATLWHGRQAGLGPLKVTQRPVSGPATPHPPSTDQGDSLTCQRRWSSAPGRRVTGAGHGRVAGHGRLAQPRHAGARAARRRGPAGGVGLRVVGDWIPAANSGRSCANSAPGGSRRVPAGPRRGAGREPNSLSEGRTAGRPPGLLRVLESAPAVGSLVVINRAGTKTTLAKDLVWPMGLAWEPDGQKSRSPRRTGRHVFNPFVRKIALTADASAYVFSYLRHTSTLFVVSGPGDGKTLLTARARRSALRRATRGIRKGRAPIRQPPRRSARRGSIRTSPAATRPA